MIRSLNPFKENVPVFAFAATVKTTEHWDIFFIDIPIRILSQCSYAHTANGEKYALIVLRPDQTT